MFTSLVTDAFMTIVAYFDMLMVRRDPARGREKEGTQGVVAVLRKKVQGCESQNSDPMHSIPLKAGELGLNASTGHSMKFSGCI